MKPRREKGRISGRFVPLLKDTMKSAAWRAASHGARSLYAALKGRYNGKLGNAGISVNSGRGDRAWLA